MPRYNKRQVDLVSLRARQQRAGKPLLEGHKKSPIHLSEESKRDIVFFLKTNAVVTAVLAYSGQKNNGLILPMNLMTTDVYGRKQDQFQNYPIHTAHELYVPDNESRRIMTQTAKLACFSAGKIVSVGCGSISLTLATMMRSFHHEKRRMQTITGENYTRLTIQTVNCNNIAMYVCFAYCIDVINMAKKYGGYIKPNSKFPGARFKFEWSRPVFVIFPSGK